MTPLKERRVGRRVRSRPVEVSRSKTPFTTEVELAPDDIVTVRVMLSMDPGPMRAFAPFLDVPLDEAHATELLCKLGMVLEQLRARRPARASRAAL